MNLQERWEKEESKIGKLFKYGVGYIATLSGVIAEASSTYLPAFSNIPEWLTHSMVVIGVVGYVAGKLTVKHDTNKG